MVSWSFPSKGCAFNLTQLILVPYFSHTCLGCNGPTSDTSNYLRILMRSCRSYLRLTTIVHSWGVVRPRWSDSAGALIIPPDLRIEYSRPRRDSVVARGGSPDSADTARSSPPQSPPTRGRYVRPLVLQKVKEALTPCRRFAPCNARLRYPIMISNLSRRTRWQARLHFTAPWSA